MGSGDSGSGASHRPTGVAAAAPTPRGVLSADSDRLVALVTDFHAAVDATAAFEPKCVGDECTTSVDVRAAPLGVVVQAVQHKLVKTGVRVMRLTPALAIPDDVTVSQFRFFAVTRHLRPDAVVVGAVLTPVVAAVGAFADDMRALDVQIVVDNTVAKEPVVKLALVAVYIEGPSPPPPRVAATVVDASAPPPLPPPPSSLLAPAQPGSGAGDTPPVVVADSDDDDDSALCVAACRHPVLWSGTRDRHARMRSHVAEFIGKAVAPGSAFSRNATQIQRAMDKRARSRSRARGGGSDGSDGSDSGGGAVLNDVARVALAAAICFNNSVTVPGVTNNDIAIASGKDAEIVVTTDYRHADTPAVTTVSLDDAACMACAVNPAAQSHLAFSGATLDGRVNWCVSGSGSPCPGFAVNVAMGHTRVTVANV